METVPQITPNDNSFSHLPPQVLANFPQNYPYVRGEKYENAETELKIQESHLKEAETKLKFQEVDFKEAEVELKNRDSQLIEQKVEMEKLCIKMKKMEMDRYKKETKHLDELYKIKETELNLKNLDKRFEMVNKIGLNFGNRTDFETVLKMTKLLGDDIPKDFLHDLNAIKKRIGKKMDLKDLVYS